MMTEDMKALDMGANYLSHHGILGQKWGVRRYQNADGTWTKEGLERRREAGDVHDAIYDPATNVTSFKNGNRAVEYSGDMTSDQSQKFLKRIMETFPSQDVLRKEASEALLDNDDFKSAIARYGYTPEQIENGLDDNEQIISFYYGGENGVVFFGGTMPDGRGFGGGMSFYKDGTDWIFEG